ncbi:MAG: hypothetical protein RLZZ383_2366, partial [Pseudomonadota bacterium]
MPRSMLRVSLAAALAGCASPRDPTPEAGPAVVDPGHRPLRRINRAELDRMFRDLTATSLRPGLDFPPDDAASGFDNHAEALGFSPLFLELAEAAAGAVARDLLDAGRVPEQVLAVDGAAWTATEPGDNGPSGNAFAFYGDGAASWRPAVSVAGTYRLDLDVRTTPGDVGPALLAVSVDGIDVDTVSIDAPQQAASVSLALTPGATLSLRFLNDVWDPDASIDRNVWLDAAALEGPFDRPAPIPPERAEALPCSVVGLG